MLRDADAIAPIAGDEADLPLEVIAVGLVGVAARVGHRPLAHVPMLEAGDLALGEGRVPSVGAPTDDPERGVGVGGSASIEDVVGGLGVGRVGGRVARRESGEAFRVRELVAVDQRRGDLLRHAFEEGADFGQPELGGVAVQVGDVLVDHGVGFEVAAGVDDLRGGRLGVRHALVEQAPSCLREAGPDGSLVAGGEVAFDDHHVVEDFVRLGKQLDDHRHAIIVIERFSPSLRRLVQLSR